jgi:hypothetical protein
MAQPQTAIQIGPVTSIITVNSLDRYANGVPPAASSNQTSCTDITYPLPGLSNIATVQLTSTAIRQSTWYSQAGFSNALSTPFYTNLINLINYTTGITYLITIPPTNLAIGSVISNLGKYVAASTYGGSAVGSVPVTCTVGLPTSFDPIAASTGNFWTWFDSGRSAATSHSLGWGRVTIAPDGTNIVNRRQLFDLLGLANHVPSVAGLGSLGQGYATGQYLPTNLTNSTGPIRYVSMISPQLTNFAPDVTTNVDAPPNEIGRFAGTTISSSGAGIEGLSAKVFKVQPGATSLRIQLLDDLGDPIPTNYPVPAPYQGAPTPGVGILSTTLSNLTFSAIANANVTFPTGTQVSIVTTSGSPGAFTPGVYKVESATSNTVVIPYLTTSASQISNATYGFTIQPVWLTSTAGNQNGPEYSIQLNGIARTTTA